MKKPLEQLVRKALIAAAEAGVLKSPGAPPIVLEIPKDPALGDLACTVALGLARQEKAAPRAIAESIVRHLLDPEGILAGIEIAGPGYINFRFSTGYWRSCIEAIEDGRFRASRIGDGARVQVEFVSANPTGPLTVGHGRNAVLGDALARLLEATGHTVTREYYFNNAGRQMTMLGESVKARYLELLGDDVSLPDGGYQGAYIVAIAEDLKAQHGAELRGELASGAFKQAAEAAIFRDIKQTLGRMKVQFDVYFNEDSLYQSGRIDAVLAELRKRDLAFYAEGAVWLRGERLGLPKDRVLVKSTGEPAYRLPDIAYHQEKLERGFDSIIDVLGADHIDEHEEVRVALAGLGLDASRVRAVIYQFVTLTRGGVQVKMSTRRAEYVTVDELIEEVGTDAVRFFFLTRKADTHLEFDLDLATKQSADNPVFYVQYAHARVCSLYRQASAAGIEPSHVAAAPLEPLSTPEELTVIKLLAQYGDVVEDAARALEPHRVVFYLIELASEFHRFYNRHRVVTEDRATTLARLRLAGAVRTVLRDGLELLGVSAPESM